MVCAGVGNEIVVEEFLDGEEASFFALIDGETCVALASAQVDFFFLFTAHGRWPFKICFGGCSCCIIVC